MHNASTQPDTQSGCECSQDVDTVYLTKKLAGAGGQFTINAIVVRGTENHANPQVCRITSVEGPLQKTSTRSADDTPQQKMRKFQLVGEPTLEAIAAAGHVVADTLGGPNSTWNLVPMDDNFNNGGGWKSMELRIAKCLEDPKTKQASMKVVLTYPKSGKYQYFPNWISVTITINNSPKKPIEFSPQKGADPRQFNNSDCFSSW